MSLTTKFANKHKFTSRGTEAVLPADITLEPGRDENLYIEELKTNEIFDTVTSDSLGQNGLTFHQRIQSESFDTQGAEAIIKYDSVNELYYLLYTSYNAASPTTGSATIMKSGTGDVFTTQRSFNLATNVDNDFTHIGLSNDTTRILVSGTEEIYDYARTGNLWTQQTNTVLVDTDGVSMNDQFHLTLDGSLKLWNGSTLVTELVATGASNVFCMQDTKFIYYHSGYFYEYRLSGATWNLAVTTEYALTFTSMYFFGDIMVCTTSSRMYIFDIAGGYYTLLIDEAYTNPIVTTDGATVFVADSAGIYVYQKNAENAYAKLDNDTALTNVSSLSISGTYLAVGRPTIDTDGVVDVYRYLFYANSNVADNYVTLNTDKVSIGRELEALEFYTDNIYGQMPNPLVINDLTNEEIYQYSNTTLARAQGQSVTISDVLSDTDVYMVVGNPVPSDSGSVTAVRSLKALPIFNLDEQFIKVGLPTSDNEIGYYSSMNKGTGEWLAYVERPTLSGLVLVFKRLGSTWSFEDALTTPAVRSIKLDSVGDRILLAYASGNVSVFIRTGTSWTLEQNLFVGAGAKTAISYECTYTDSLTVSFSLGLSTWVYTSDATLANWALNTTLATDESAVDQYLYGNFLCVVSTSTLYIFARADPDPASTYFLYQEINTTYTQLCCAMNANYVFVGSSTGIMCYYKDPASGLFAASGIERAVSSPVVSIDCNSVFVVGGAPAYDAANGSVFCYLIETLDPNGQTTVNTIEMGNDFDLNITSDYGTINLAASEVALTADTVTLDGTLDITGPIESSGTIAINAPVIITNSLVYRTIYTQITKTSNTQVIPSQLFPRTLITSYDSVYETGASSGFLGYNLGLGTLTIGQSGVFVVEAFVEFTANAAGIRGLEIDISGTGVNLQTVPSIGAGISTTMSQSTTLVLNAGAVLKLGVLQDSGFAVLMIARAELRILRLGSF